MESNIEIQKIKLGRKEDTTEQFQYETMKFFRKDFWKHRPIINLPELLQALLFGRF